MNKSRAIINWLVALLIFSYVNNSFSQRIKIGIQTWTAKNLNVSVFRNGDVIPEAKTDVEWVKAGIDGKPVWCYYDNEKANGTKYGRLYNWYAINDKRGLAPKGWHLPTDVDWTTLIDYLGGESDAGISMQSASGFVGLPGGGRNQKGEFGSKGYDGYWWSATEKDTDFAWNIYLGFYDGRVTKENDLKISGLSVRCVED